MARAKDGPIGYTQWTEALSRPLSPDNAAYMLRGKCEKKFYSTLFNRLSDYVTDAFNAALNALTGFNGSNVDLVFALKRLTATYRIALFFKDIKWIEPCDKSALMDSLKTAALAAAARLRQQTDDPDVLYECAELTKTANGVTR